MLGDLDGGPQLVRRTELHGRDFSMIYDDRAHVYFFYTHAMHGHFCLLTWANLGPSVIR